MSDFWSVTSETESTTLTVNGSTSSVEPGSDFKQAVIGAARDAGLGKFRVFLDGEEIDPADAPATIEEGMAVEIKPYEEAGA